MNLSNFQDCKNSRKVDIRFGELCLKIATNIIKIIKFLIYSQILISVNIQIWKWFLFCLDISWCFAIFHKFSRIRPFYLYHRDFVISNADGRVIKISNFHSINLVLTTMVAVLIKWFLKSSICCFQMNYKIYIVNMSFISTSWR